MKYLNLGVIATSYKENEYRLPIHPSHLFKIDKQIRSNIYFEQGYGDRFGIKDDHFSKYFNKSLPRNVIFEKCKIILLPKTEKYDYSFFKKRQILWGWCHCIQNKDITQTAINKQLTLITWENMHKWKNFPNKELHIFHRNNELAGYCAVCHSLQLTGISGYYGKFRKVAIICFGDTARGAIFALKGMGFSDITVYTRRLYRDIKNLIPGVKYRLFQQDHSNSHDIICENWNGKIMIPMHKILAQYDIIVNCILQDTKNPLIFLKTNDIKLLQRETLIIDVSCDAKMGFEFAQPTSFNNPIINLGRGIQYYSVDHTPSYLWRAATHEISEALIPSLNIVMQGQKAWNRDNTIKNAIEINEGKILNPKILHFQNRKSKYPHKIK